MSRFMETPTMTHFKALKRILWYIKGIVDFGLFYGYSNSFELVGYRDSDWTGDIDDRKNTTSFVFFIGDTSFIRSSNKQSIVTLSLYETEYVATTSYVARREYHKRLLKELWMS